MEGTQPGDAQRDALRFGAAPLLSSTPDMDGVSEYRFATRSHHDRCHFEQEERRDAR